jgi:sedoheptulokinase
MKIAGLDIGTSTLSGVLWDMDSAVCLETLTLPNSSQIPSPTPWEDLQDPEKIFKAAQDILAQFQHKVDKIAGIGLTGQMHGILYVDAEGRGVSPLFTWQDGRGDLPYQKGHSYAETLSSLIGYRMSTGFGLTTHFYNLKNGQAPECASSICTIADYIAMRLGGLSFPVMHPSLAHSLGIFDLTSGQFDEAALQAAGINREILPEVDLGEVQIGRTPEGVPVCVPIGDNQASFLGAIRPDAKVLLNIGTGSQLSALSETVLEIPLLETRPYIRDAFLLVGSALCGGSAYSLLRNFFSQILRELGGLEPENLDEKLETLGKQAYPSKNRLEVDTRFKGSRADPMARGAIGNVGIDTFTPGDMVVGFLTGMVDELKQVYDQLPETLQNADCIVGSGHAIRRNALLRRIIEDRFAKTLRVAAYEEEAALGAARWVGEILMGV